MYLATTAYESVVGHAARVRPVPSVAERTLRQLEGVQTMIERAGRPVPSAAERVLRTVETTDGRLGRAATGSAVRDL
jgi:hypothetical protein